MICCLQPHIDLYSRFELNHVPVIVNGDPLDQPSDQSVVILRHHLRQLLDRLDEPLQFPPADTPG